MNTIDQIADYIAGQPNGKRADIESLNALIRSIMPGCKLWFLDGRDETGKIVSNPNIGYGTYLKRYTDGSSREFYQIGLSANSTGISIYIMGIEDRKYLPETFANSIGKASVTGYCIRFKRLDEIDLEVLEAAIKAGIKASSGSNE